MSGRARRSNEMIQRRMVTCLYCMQAAGRDEAKRMRLKKKEEEKKHTQQKGRAHRTPLQASEQVWTILLRLEFNLL